MNKKIPQVSVLLFFILLITGFTNHRTGNITFEIPLYEGAVPNSIPSSVEEIRGYDPLVDSLVSYVSKPTLTAFLPSSLKANGTAVIICPGGGYHTLLISREGKEVARAFNEAGIAAFVLKYRLPDDRYMKDKAIGPLQDAQKAIQTVREHAAQWGINPEKIGIMGFSAGGHLAATAGTHFNNIMIENKKNTSLRPDFMILINPVISFTDKTANIDSRTSLVGTNLTAEKIRFFSNELQITAATPPGFLTHANDDKVVAVANSMDFFSALQKNAVSAELHIYAAGDHGFLQQTPPFSEWFGRCLYWMKSKKWIE